MTGASRTLRHGTRLAFEDERLVAVVDRREVTHATLAWDDGRLVGLEVPAPPGGRATTLVRGERVAHVLFGDAHPVMTSEGGAEPVTWMGAIDWARPLVIPPIEHPARVPGGAGTTVLNTLAMLAREAGVLALRYAGPYPTSALWQSLRQSFRTRGEEAAFTAGALARAASGDMSPVAIDFVPAPFERLWVKPGVAVQLRDGIERVLVGGEAYVPGEAVRRLTALPQGATAADVWIGGAPYARIATFDAKGDLTGGPFPPPPPVDPVVGQVLPALLKEELAGLVAEMLPAPLAGGTGEVLAAMRVEWGDAGAAAVRDLGERVVLHAAIWQRVAPFGMAQVGLALAEALAPVVAARAQARLAALLTAAVGG